MHTQLLSADNVELDLPCFELSVNGMTANAFYGLSALCYSKSRLLRILPVCRAQLRVTNFQHNVRLHLGMCYVWPIPLLLAAVRRSRVLAP